MSRKAWVLWCAVDHRVLLEASSAVGHVFFPAGNCVYSYYGSIQNGKCGPTAYTGPPNPSMPKNVFVLYFAVSGRV